MKVAHIVYNLSIGGVTSVINQLFSDSDLDIEQILILLSEDDVPQNLGHIKCYKVDYKYPDDYSLMGLMKLIFFPRNYFGNVANAINLIWHKEKFDIFHFHGLPKDLPIGRMLKKEIPLVKLVYTDHSLRISQKEYNTRNGKILAKLYARFYKPYNTIFVSKMNYEAGMRIGFIGKKRHNCFIENSISIESIKIKKSYFISEKLRIVYVSRISAVKGHFTLLRVAQILISKYNLRNFQFTLIGPGELTEQLQQEINSKNLNSYFQLEGAKSNVYSLLADFDLGVFPSEREGLPIALLEKMAAGLPVVASDIPEIKNVIQKENEALLYPTNNAEVCADKLYSLIQNQRLREDIGNSAKNAVRERYSRPLLDKYKQFYQKILDKK